MWHGEKLEKEEGEVRKSRLEVPGNAEGWSRRLGMCRNLEKQGKPLKERSVPPSDQGRNEAVGVET